MIKVTAKGVYDVSNISCAIELYEQLITESRKELGCIKYELYQDIKDEKILTVIEEWESMDHLKAHFEQPHFKKIGPQIAKLRILNSELNIYKLVK